MTDQGLPFQSTVEREDNPKAVFFGTEEKIITPLALYLTERNVELYSANVLSDAFFGNYFFYIGTSDYVEDFLEESGSQLPKSLLLMTASSDLTVVKKLVDRLPHVKVVLLGMRTEIDTHEAEEVLTFFFGSDEAIFILPHRLTERHVIGQERSVSPRAEVEESPQLPTKPQTEAPVEVNARIPESKASVANSKTKFALETFFTGQPNSTGKSSARHFPHRLPVVKASIIVLCLLVIFPLVALGLELSLGSLHLYFAYRSLLDTNFIGLEKDLKGARFFFRVAEINLESISGLFTMVRGQYVYRQLHQLTQAARRTSHGSLYLVTALKDGETLINGITGAEKGVSFGQVMSAIKGDLTLADTELGLVEAELKTESLNDFFTNSHVTFLRVNYPKLVKQLSELRHAVVTARGALVLVPEVSGFYGKRTYLVVFQNNMELRPTGGFIGSYGLMSFEDGVFKEFTIEDVYTADGALKGHIDPPEPIRVHLGQEHWYLRDGNWDPDFTRTGARLAWFLDKEIEVSVDGVIGVDLTFIQSLLEVTGGVTISDYKEHITANNLFITAQAAAEAGFFPGSSQKKDFLGAVGRSLIRTLVEDGDVSQLAILKQIHGGFASRHLLVYFVNPATQVLASALGWTGSFDVPTNCQTACVADFLSVVDANLGVNKVNYYITREVTDNVSFSEDGQVHHELTVTYKNDSPETTAKIGGDYKNYVRVYVPPDAQLIQASFDSLPLTIATGSVASGSSVTVLTEGELRVFEGLVVVEPRAVKTLTLKYDRAVALPATDQLAYYYKIQKQAGTLADALRVTVEYPTSWRLVSRDEGGEVSGATTLAEKQKISYTTSLATDELIKANFKL